MPEPIFLTTDQVAARLGILPAHFRGQLEDLLDRHDFPQPMPYRGPKGAMIWRAAHVDAWLMDQGLPKTFTPPRRTDDPKVRVLFREARTA